MPEGLRRGWREPIEPGIYRVHRVACPSSADEKPGRRCGCPYSVRVPGGTGTSRTLKVPGTREDARRERAKRIGADRQVVVVPMGESTVHELALDYFAASAPSWQASTTELADGLYKSWVMPKWGETIASTLTKADVVLWMASGRATKAPRRADQALSLLRRILGHAADSTPPKLTQNVAIGVKPPKAKQAAHPTFTPAQADALVAACKTARDRVLVLLGLHGGLRIGEARGLRWSDLALDEKRIRIERAVWQGKGRERHVKEPKSDRRRRVFVTPELASALADLRAEAAGNSGFDETDYVLGGRKGQPMARKSGYQALQRIADRAGVKDAAGKVLTGTHRLRRTSASLALHDGVPLPVVSAQLGHANTRITAQAYSHVLEDAQLDAYGTAFGDRSVREAVREKKTPARTGSTKRRKAS